MNNLLTVLIIAGIVVLVLLAILLSIIIFQKINLKTPILTRNTRASYHDELDNSVKKQSEQEREEEERRNWKPSRDKVFFSELDLFNAPSKPKTSQIVIDVFGDERYEFVGKISYIAEVEILNEKLNYTRINIIVPKEKEIFYSQFISILNSIKNNISFVPVCEQKI